MVVVLMKIKSLFVSNGGSGHGIPVAGAKILESGGVCSHHKRQRGQLGRRLESER